VAVTEWARPSRLLRPVRTTAALTSAAALDAVRPRSELVAENALLRLQILVLARAAPPRPRLFREDRLLLVLLARVNAAWRDAVVCENSAHRGLRGLAVVELEHAAEPRAARDRACADRRCLGRDIGRPAKAESFRRLVVIQVRRDCDPSAPRLLPARATEAAVESESSFSLVFLEPARGLEPRTC
jgi:hypothetical protein